MDLKIKTDGDWSDGVTATWTATGMKPGDSYSFYTKYVDMKSEGSITPNHLEITSDYSVIEEDPCVESDTDCKTNEHPDEMAKEMLITRCVYHNAEWCFDCLTGEKWSDYSTATHECSGTKLGEDTKWKIENKSGDGKISFYDLKNDKLDDLIPPDGTTTFEMSVKFDESAGNDFQGDTFNLTMIFTLNQESSQ
jgi:hypothetical protein